VYQIIMCHGIYDPQTALKMFAKATKNVLSEIDTEGSLIPLTRLNDSDGLVPLSLVIKRNRYWFWQRPKYLTLDFNLNDVLVGDPINPGTEQLFCHSLLKWSMKA